MHGYENPWPGGAGKNKLQVTANTKTVSGVNFTVNADGTISATGQASEDIVLSIGAVVSDGSSYIGSGCPAGGNVNQTYGMFFSFLGGESGNGTGAAVVSSGSLITTNIVIKAGYTASNLVFKPMIRLASETDATFAPYSNICPISGWTGLSVKRTGGNVASVNPFYASGKNTQITKDPASGSITVVNTSAVRYCGASAWYNGILAAKLFPRGVYTVSFDITGTITTGWTAGTRSVETIVFDATERVAFSSPGHYSFTFDSSAWTYDKYLSISRVGNETSDVNVTISNLTIVPGAAEGSFEPYVSQDISVNWEDEAGTVYGGTLTINPDRTGTLVADWVYTVLPKDVNQWQTYDYQNRHGVSCRNALPTIEERANGICSHDEVTFFNVWIGVTSDYFFWIGILDRLNMTFEEFQAWVATQTIQVAYIISNPVTHTLTAEQVSGILNTLYGTNNIWANTGDVTVTYIAKSAKFSFGSPLRIYNYNNLKLFGNTYIEHGKG